MKTTLLIAGAIARFRDLKKDESGNVAVIFALALLPLTGFVGASVDYSHANAVSQHAGRGRCHGAQPGEERQS